MAANSSTLIRTEEPEFMKTTTTPSLWPTLSLLQMLLGMKQDQEPSLTMVNGLLWGIGTESSLIYFIGMGAHTHSTRMSILDPVVKESDVLG